MDDSLSTAATVDHDPPKLDLGHLPPVYVLAAHLSISEQHEAEDALSGGGAPLTYDIKEARIVLGNIVRARRAKSELQWKSVFVEDIVQGEENKQRSPILWSGSKRSTSARKRIRLGHGGEKGLPTGQVDPMVDGSSTASEVEDEAATNAEPISQLSKSQVLTPSTVASSDTVQSFRDRVKVVRLDWLNESLSAGKVLSLEPYIIYEARLTSPDESAVSVPQVVKFNGVKPSSAAGKEEVALPPVAKTNGVKPSSAANQRGLTSGIIERASADPKPSVARYRKRDQIKDAANRDSVGKSFLSSARAAIRLSSQHLTRPTHLLHQTTSEHDESVSTPLPALPDWIRENKVYSCERATPLDSPNKAFISQLTKVKLARLLTLDEIGVRAYSTSIASLAAYPYPIQSTREVLALPGCDQKIAHLFHEYQSSNGRIQAIEDLESNPALKILHEFHEIWGVGPKTAREFYYDKGWRDLDDIIEHGWKSLSRVQQIGLKYYDEFQLKIPRAEVEAIAATISSHARRVTVSDDGVETIIVGGYRRGKPESGDVDVILSHPNEAMTHSLVEKMVKSLEKEGWITHTLILDLTNTKRNQETLPISTGALAGHGFDTLDKALVVWQDPNWPTKAADLAANPKAKNPNPHRRVDIIISPWRTIGCAVAGWTSGTTFQRDLRRYAKHVKGWKFDSSGVRERGTGRWVDLERWTDKTTRCRDWREAERRVFEGLGLVYREPWDRCTG